MPERRCIHKEIPPRQQQDETLTNSSLHLIPKNNSPLFAFSTSSSSSRPSLAVHQSSLSMSSAFFPLLIADSKVDFLAFRLAIRRGSEWPVRMISAVRAGRDA